MTITRNLDYTANTDGADHASDVDDTANKIFSMNLGRLTSVAGTNTITGNASISTGLTAIGDDAECSFVAINTNTGAVTLNIQSLGAIAVRNSAGVALIAGDIASGNIYRLNYDSVEAFWRITSFIPTSVGAVDSVNYIHTVAFIASGTFTAPYAMNARIIVVGAGGGGGGYRDNSEAKGSGGGAGGVSMLELAVGNGETFTIIVGANGTGSNNNAGTAGGNSSAASLSGPSSVTVTGGGGGGGSRGIGATLSGGAGGSASGGDDNFAGGNGGDVVSGSTVASGGGACGITQDGLDAPDATSDITVIGGGFSTDATAAGYNGVNDIIFDVSGVKGGQTVGDNGGNYCGGAGDVDPSNAVVGGGGGVGAGGGGGSHSGVLTSQGGPGGPGVVIIQYTGEI